MTIKETMAVHAWMAMDRIEPLLQTMVDLPAMVVIRGSLDRGSMRGTSDRVTIESETQTVRDGSGGRGPRILHGVTEHRAHIWTFNWAA